MNELLSRFAEIFKSMTVFDFIDIAVVAGLIFVAYKFIRERRAGKLAFGIVMLIVLAGLSELLNLRTVGFVMSNLFQVGLIALIIVFQPELRSALEKMGGVREYINHVGANKEENQMAENIESVCNAVCDMSLDKTGALIVFERKTNLDDIIKSGTLVNADISSNLIKNIFYKNSPLHDGAMIIREGRIISAKCMLPLTANSSADSEYATRHRAAIGMSEASDAIVIVVSEQTGIISVAIKGELDRNYDYRKLYTTLTAHFSQAQQPSAEGDRRSKRRTKKSKDTSDDNKA